MEKREGRVIGKIEATVRQMEDEIVALTQQINRSDEIEAIPLRAKQDDLLDRIKVALSQ